MGAAVRFVAKTRDPVRCEGAHDGGLLVQPHLTFDECRDRLASAAGAGRSERHHGGDRRSGHARIRGPSRAAGPLCRQRVHWLTAAGRGRAAERAAGDQSLADPRPAARSGRHAGGRARGVRTAPGPAPPRPGSARGWTSASRWCSATVGTSTRRACSCWVNTTRSRRSRQGGNPRTADREVVDLLDQMHAPVVAKLRDLLRAARHDADGRWYFGP